MQININEISYTHAYWIFLLPLIGAAADIVTGWIQATINHTWDSSKMRIGLMRKGGEILVVFFAYIAEIAVAVVAQAHVATFFSLYIVLMEVISVIENLDQAGVTVPGFLRERLGKIKDQADKGE